MAKLKEMLEKQLELEAEARDLYEKYLKKFEDPEIVRTLGKIRDDEIKHVRIVKNMLSLVE